MLFFALSVLQRAATAGALECLSFFISSIRWNHSVVGKVALFDLHITTNDHEPCNMEWLSPKYSISSQEMEK